MDSARPRLYEDARSRQLRLERVGLHGRLWPARPPDPPESWVGSSRSRGVRGFGLCLCDRRPCQHRAPRGPTESAGTVASGRTSPAWGGRRRERRVARPSRRRKGRRTGRRSSGAARAGHDKYPPPLAPRFLSARRPHDPVTTATGLRLTPDGKDYSRGRRWPRPNVGGGGLGPSGPPGSGTQGRNSKETRGTELLPGPPTPSSLGPFLPLGGGGS